MSDRKPITQITILIYFPGAPYAGTGMMPPRTAAHVSHTKIRHLDGAVCDLSQASEVHSLTPNISGWKKHDFHFSTPN